MFAIRVAASALLMAAVAWVPAAAIASDTSDVMTTVNTAVSSFNKGDGKTWLTTCTSSAPVVSNIPPYEFHSCAAWWTANVAWDKNNAVSGETVTLGKAWTLTITGDRAYGSFPANLTFKQKGKAMSASGVLTIALQKTAGSWLMTGWSWSAHS